MAEKQKGMPSSAGTLIGILLMVLGLGGCIAGVALGISEIKDAVDAAQRVDVPANQEYSFEENASGFIVGFGDSSSAASSIDVTLTGPGGAVDLNDSSFSSSGTSGSDSFEILGAFDATDAGTYTLTATGEEGTRVAIVNLSLGSAVAKIVGGPVGGAVLFLIGLILVIVTMVRRGKAKKRLAAGGFTPPPGAGFPPPAGAVPPPPGFGGAPPQAPPAPGYAPPAPQAPPAPPAQGYPPPAPQAPPAPPAPKPTPWQQPAPEAPPAAPPAAPPPPSWGNDAPPPPPSWGNDAPPPPPPPQQ